MENQDLITDEALLRLAFQGDAEAEEALLRRYAPLVRSACRPLFLAGGDSEDLIQEGMLGLLSAIRRYDPASGAAFRTFAEKCVKNRLLSALRQDQRQKNRPLNDSVPMEDDRFTPRPPRELEDLIISRERASELLFGLTEKLSKMENRVLRLYLEGRSYPEIAEKLGIGAKSVDNAVQRIRKKLSSGDTGFSRRKYTPKNGQESQK